MADPLVVEFMRLISSRRDGLDFPRWHNFLKYLSGSKISTQFGIGSRLILMLIVHSKNSDFHFGVNTFWIYQYSISVVKNPRNVKENVRGDIPILRTFLYPLFDALEIFTDNTNPNNILRFQRVNVIHPPPNVRRFWTVTCLRQISHANFPTSIKGNCINSISPRDRLQESVTRCITFGIELLMPASAREKWRLQKQTERYVPRPHALSATVRRLAPAFECIKWGRWQVVMCTRISGHALHNASHELIYI